MKLKKALSVLGLLAVSVAPVASVVACGNSKPNETFDLSRVISNKNLQDIKYGEGAVFKELVLDKLVTMYPLLDTSAIQVKEADLDASSTTATIMPKEGNKKYSGTVEVQFKFVLDNDLSKLINSNLGDIKYAGSPSSDDLKILILNRIQEFDADVMIDITKLTVVETLTVDDEQATIAPIDNATYTGQAVVAFNFFVPTNLADVVTTPSLGHIPYNPAETNPIQLVDALLDAIEHKYDLNRAHFALQDPNVEVETESATIIPADGTDYYTGSVTITFYFSIALDIKIPPDNNNLEMLTYMSGDDSDALKDLVLTAVATKYSLDKSDIAIKEDNLNVEDTTAKIIPATGADKYAEYADVFFNFVGQLSSFVTDQSDLGIVGYNQDDSDSLKADVLAAIAIAHPDIDASELEVANSTVATTNTEITLQAKANSTKYVGQTTVKVLFSQELSAIIDHPALGNIGYVSGAVSANDLKADILAIVGHRFGIDATDLDISESLTTNSTTATIVPSSGSPYTGGQAVTFAFVAKTDLSTLVSNPSLGDVSYNGAKSVNETVEDALKAAYTSLDLGQIKIQDPALLDVYSTATTVVPANVESLYTGQVTITFSVVPTWAKLGDVVTKTSIILAPTATTPDPATDINLIFTSVKAANTSITFTAADIEIDPTVTSGNGEIAIRGKDSSQSVWGTVTLRYSTQVMLFAAPKSNAASFSYDRSTKIFGASRVSYSAWDDPIKDNSTFTIADADGKTLLTWTFNQSTQFGGNGWNWVPQALSPLGVGAGGGIVMDTGYTLTIIQGSAADSSFFPRVLNSTTNSLEQLAQGNTYTYVLDSSGFFSKK